MNVQYKCNLTRIFTIQKGGVQMRVLAIGAHPDDIEIACAGTLLKCRERGDEVFVCHLSNGDLGHEIIQPDELGLMRRQEAQNAGKLGGFTVIWGGFTDLCVFDNKVWVCLFSVAQ